MKGSTIAIIILILITIGVVVWVIYKQKEPTKDSTDKLIDSLRKAEMVDSLVKERMTKAMFDTVGLSLAPVKITEAFLFKEEYSSFRNIRMVWKNISKKKITAIRFSWYGTNAFGEPADMGTSITKGFGGGYTDESLGPGKVANGIWSILSRDGKKIVLAWPYEVVFEDGTKWKTSRN
jgi:hypothetical protein